jgi:hypothetical protein
VRIAPARLAELTAAEWVDVCQVTQEHVAGDQVAQEQLAPGQADYSSSS